MQTLTAGRVRARHAAGAATIVAYPGAAAFVIAAAWFWLATKGVTVATAPRIGPDVPPQQAMRIYYRWQATTLPQERYYTSIAIAGFLCLAAAAIFLRDLLGRDRALARIGALAIGAGALLWITGSVLELGGHRAVGLMATHANPIQATNSIAFTIDTIAAAFALAAFALIGAGMLAFAAARPRPRPSRMGQLHNGCRAGDAGHRRVLRRRQRQPLGPDAVRRRCGAAAGVADLDRPLAGTGDAPECRLTCECTRRRT